MSENVLRQGLTRYLSPARLEALRAARVGVAGAGGLGSNAVLMLARSGVEHFLLIDDDVVDASNLNRQQFWPRHLGCPKVEALAELVRELNPDARVETCRLRIDAANVDELVARCPLWLEAMDGAADKRLLVEKVMLSGRRIASASGMGGFGGKPMQKRVLGTLGLVGDSETDIREYPPAAPLWRQAHANSRARRPPRSTLLPALFPYMTVPRSDALPVPGPAGRRHAGIHPHRRGIGLFREAPPPDASRPTLPGKEDVPTPTAACVASGYGLRLPHRYGQRDGPPFFLHVSP